MEFMDQIQGNQSYFIRPQQNGLQVSQSQQDILSKNKKNYSTKQSTCKHKKMCEEEANLIKNRIRLMSIQNSIINKKIEQTQKKAQQFYLNKRAIEELHLERKNQREFSEQKFNELHHQVQSQKLQRLRDLEALREYQKENFDNHQQLNKQYKLDMKIQTDKIRNTIRNQNRQRYEEEQAKQYQNKLKQIQHKQKLQDQLQCQAQHNQNLQSIIIEQSSNELNQLEQKELDLLVTLQQTQGTHQEVFEQLKESIVLPTEQYEKKYQKFVKQHSLNNHTFVKKVSENNFNSVNNEKLQSSSSIQDMNQIIKNQKYFKHNASKPIFSMLTPCLLK